ncbi:DUF2326 domain-containing protein [Acinetobacter oleivorans]|uniref:DUF2326 domain-containing protein n=1 Tax=Acinetobacter oleivorans TaxID=1148157 RepID=UPI0021CE0981|nr:DUF2326 domain-containing protein [Acinetobacter oleivorans]MCU4409646.1 DUF2326 domain-containing protein [Acinetobacter oleivorans]
MKLSKLYSNQPTLFFPIEFKDGLNVVLGQIKHPENYKKDTHNLGKTTLAKLLDFMFLAQRHPKQFLFKKFDIFKSFTFFLEIELDDGQFLTIKRSVENNTKISFKLHKERLQDFSDLVDEQWNHNKVTFEQAKNLLDSWLNFDVLKKWNYRQVLGYLIRTQDDFNNVFKLQKHQGKDLHWKPYMADLLGFKGELATANYEKQSEISKLEDEIKPHAKNYQNLNEELSSIDGKILIRNNELKNLENFIDEFNFDPLDQEKIEELVDTLDVNIAQLNMVEYTIKNNISRIEDSLNIDEIQFDTSKVKKLFTEASILFPEQITKDFEQLITFNKMITEERKSYLNEELNSLKIELEEAQNELTTLNQERSKQISFLGETEVVQKFKQSNNQLAQIKGDIEFLNKQKEVIDKVLLLEKQKRELQKSLDIIQNDMQINVQQVNEDTASTFSKIRIYFNEIINEILDKEGSITVYLNNEGNFEFDASYRDKKGIDTSEGDGHSYRQLLCFAFDLAVARAYIDKNYPKFLYIDGVFDNLDIRKKRNTLNILRKYTELGIQIIITTIESEVSELSSKDKPVFSSDEIILVLHDDGQAGRLFKIPIW